MCRCLWWLYVTICDCWFMFIPGWKGLHKQRGVQSWITLLLKLSWILHKKISICWCWDVLGGGFQSPSHDSMEGSNLATCFVWQHIPGQNMSNWSKATLPDAVGWCQLYICSAFLRRHGYFQKKHVRSPDYQDYFKKNSKWFPGFLFVSLSFSFLDFWVYSKKSCCT